MPDNEINIKINLNTAESGTSLQRIHQQLNAIIADSERAARQQGWAGLQKVEQQLDSIASKTAEIRAGLGLETPVAPVSVDLRSLNVDQLREHIRARVQDIEAGFAEPELQKRVAEEYVTNRTISSARSTQEIIERQTGVTRPKEKQEVEGLGRAIKEDLPSQRLVSPAYLAVARQEDEARNQAGIQRTTAIVEREQARQTATAEREARRREQIADREAVSAQRAAAQATIKREREEEIVGNATIRAAAEREKAQQVYDEEGENHKDSFRRQELIQVRQFEAYKARATKEEAVAREQSEREVYQTALKENKQFDQQQKEQDRLYTQAVQENKIFEQQRHRGYYTATEEDTLYGDIHQQDIIRRTPTRRQALASYAEMNAEEESRSGSGISRFFGRLNRQGALEAQAAVVNTVQALASGMNPAHVAMMEGTQLAGSAIQGGLVSLNTIFTAMVSPVGMLVTGLGAAATATVAWSYSIARANEALANVQNLTVLQGREGHSGSSIRAETSEMADRIRTSGFLGRQDSREAAIAIQSIPNISEDTRRRLAGSTEALGRARFGGDQGETNKFVQSTFSDTSKIKSFAEEMNLIEGDARKTFNAAVEIGDGFTAADIAARALEERLKNISQALAAERQDQGAIGRNLDFFGLRAEAGLARRTGSFNPFALFQTPAFQVGSPVESEAIRRGVTAAERQLKVEGDINALILQRQNLQASIADTTRSPEQAQTFQRALVETNEKIADTHTPEEDRRHNVRMATLDTEIKQAENAASHDISQASRVVEAYRQKQQEITNYRTSEAARRAGIAVEESEKEKQAAQATADSRRAMALRQIQIDSQTATLRRAEIGPANISGQREVVERQLDSLAKNRDADQSAIIALQAEQVNIRRQERLEVENVNIAQIRQGELILQAKEDLAGIVTLRRQEAAIIEGSKDRSPADIIQARSNVIQSQIQAAAQARRLELEAVNSIGQAEERRYQTTSALLNLQVASGAANTWQTLPLEQQITSEGTDTQAARLQALLNTGNLERSERIRVNEQLASLYEADAQKQIELQTRVTESIKAENARRTENFKNFFSSVETASSDLLTAGLLKSQTKEQAVKSFATSVVTSFVKETENMASKYAGKGLAKLLDVKLGEGEDSSISSVLAKKAGSVLGITLDEPKVNQAAIADRMKEAGDAQKQAGDLMLQAAREMSTKAGESPYKGGKGTEFSTDIVRETEKRASTVGTSANTQRTIPPSIDAYGAPGAVMNYGRSGALGTQEEAAANLTKISAQSGATFQVHKEAAPAFQGLINDLESRGYKINPEESGGYAKREMRGGTGLSEHAFGTAIDINPSKNPWMSHQTDLPDDISEMAAKRGLVWGGNWPTKPDPMHFQWGGPNAGMALAKAATHETTYSVPSTQKTISLDEPTRITPEPKAGISGSSTEPAPIPASAGGDRQEPVQAPQYYAPSILSNPTVPSSTYFLNNALDQSEKEVSNSSAVLKESREAIVPRSSNTLQHLTQTVGPELGGSYPPSVHYAPNMDEPSASAIYNPERVQIPSSHSTSPSGVANANINSQQQWISELKSTQLKVDTSSVAQGVQQGQQNVVSTLRSSIQEGTVQGQAAAVQATNQDVVRTQENSQNVQTNAQNVQSNSQTTTANTQSVDKLTTAIQSMPVQTQSGSPGTTTATGVAGATQSSSFGATSSPVSALNKDYSYDNAPGYTYTSGPSAEDAIHNMRKSGVYMDETSLYKSYLNSAEQFDTAANNRSTFDNLNLQVRGYGDYNAGDRAVANEFRQRAADIPAQGTYDLALQQQQQAVGQNSTQLQETNSSIRDLNQTINSKDNGAAVVGGSSTVGASSVSTASTDKATASVGGLGSAASTAQSGLSLFSSAAGIASSAALLFGKNLSPTGKAIVGGIGLASNLLSFGTKAASLLAAPATGGLSLAGLFEGGGVVSAERGTIVAPIPSAAGGLHIQESSLPTPILSGLRQMAASGRTGAFSGARMTGSGPAVHDGKGGRLIIAHPGEMIVPAAETKLILSGMNSRATPTVSAMDGSMVSAEGGGILDFLLGPIGKLIAGGDAKDSIFGPLGKLLFSESGAVVPSAEAGMILDNRGGAAISMSPPRASNLRSNIDNSIREAITNVASTSNANSTNNNTTLNYTAHTTGYHPYRTRSDMEGMLRQHGSTLMRWAESNFRNGSWPQRSF